MMFGTFQMYYQLFYHNETTAFSRLLQQYVVFNVAFYTVSTYGDVLETVILTNAIVLLLISHDTVGKYVDEVAYRLCCDTQSL